MKNKIMLVFITLMLVIGLVAVGCAKPAPPPAPPPAPTPAPAPTPTPAPAKPRVVLKAITSLPVQAKTGDTMQHYERAVELYSKGQVIIDNIGGSDVVPGKEQPLALAKGTMDVCYMSGHAVAILHPLGDAMICHQLKVWEEREAGIIDFYNEYFHTVNLHFLGQTKGIQWWTLWTNNLATTPDQMLGKKIRTTGVQNFGGLKALGMVPVALPMGDIYTAMERHIIDGFLFPPRGWTTWGWAEVTKYAIGPRFMESVGYGAFINLDVWNSLSAEEQNWLVQPFIDNAKVWYGYLYWQYLGSEIGNVATKEAGVEFIEWSPEDMEWAKKTFRDAAWEAAKSAMEPEVAKGFAELTDLPYP